MSRTNAGRDLAPLVKIAALADQYRETRKNIMAQAIARARAEILQAEQALDDAVMDALNAGQTVTDVARAYTPVGNTPNRVKIYEIRKRYKDAVPSVGLFPIRWIPRVIETIHGTTTVYDAQAILSDYGPEHISGVYQWTYEDGRLEPVVDFEQPPYPNSKEYQAVLDQWLMRNPYPEVSDDDE